MSARLAALLAAAALAACCAQGAFACAGNSQLLSPLCPHAAPEKWLARVESAQGTAYITADGAFLFCRAPGKP